MVPATGPAALARWHVLMGKVVASAVCLLALLSLSLPVLSLTWLLGAATPGGIGSALAEASLFLLAAALLAALFRLQWRSWAARWNWSYAALGLLAFGWYEARSSVGGTGVILLLLCSVVLLAVFVFAWGSRRCVYMRG
jgi:hypothetical protein